MKANNGKGNNPLRDGWITPSWIYEPLHNQYNFVFDCCADGDNSKADDYSSDFLTIKGGVGCGGLLDEPAI